MTKLICTTIHIPRDRKLKAEIEEWMVGKGLVEITDYDIIQASITVPLPPVSFVTRYGHTTPSRSSFDLITFMITLVSEQDAVEFVLLYGDNILSKKQHFVENDQ